MPGENYLARGNLFGLGKLIWLGEIDLEESPFRMPNYASETSGAAIVHSKTSPSWTGSGKVFWQSLLVTPYMRAPEIILEPDNHPGNCWPFPGSQGEAWGN
ncbi:SUN domain-containing protein 3 [Coturnix japonica]|uniref:SUN domain-containing protein 3 n=1 Tax=Coturnix japonica TaxID=93934 RepID=UPI000777DEB0|nr:SUN domain-containing protein 3 [Coturnix japonica]